MSDIVVAANTGGVQLEASEQLAIDEALRLTVVAPNLVIDDQDTLDLANDYLGKIKAAWKSIEETRKQKLVPLRTRVDSIQAFFKTPLDKLADGEATVKKLILSYTQAEQEKQRKAQAALDEQARKDRERLEKQAAKAEAAGHTEKAEVLAHSAAVISAPVAMSTYVAPKGVSTKKTWKARVTDKAALIKSIIENPAFLHLIEIDTSAIDKLAKAMEGNLPLNGVECYQEETLARRVA